MVSLFGECLFGICVVCFGVFFVFNVGVIDDVIEIVVFVFGMVVVDFDVLIDKDLLMISGECKLVLCEGDDVCMYV